LWIFLALLWAPASSLGCEKNIRAARLAADAQAARDSPVGVWVHRVIINTGEIPWLAVGDRYTLTKTFDGGFYSPGPTVVPLFNFGPVGLYETQFETVCGNQTATYEDRKKFRLSEKRRAQLQTEFHAERKMLSERNLLYLALNLIHPREQGRFAAHIRLHDGSAIAGHSELHPLEKLTGYRVPERSTGASAGLIELGMGFKNTDVLLWELEGFRYLLREVSTYLEANFLARGIPAVVRILVDAAGKRVFSAAPYLFEEEARVAEDLWVLRLSGQQFVDRFTPGEKIRNMIRGLAQTQSENWRLLDPLRDPLDYRAHIETLMGAMSEEYAQYERNLAQFDVAIPRDRQPEFAEFFGRANQDHLALAAGQSVPPDYFERMPFPPGIRRIQSLPSFPNARAFIESQFRFLPRLLF